MPRPDKRFIRYPRRERPSDPEAHEPAAGDDAPPTIQVKGRHMVVPRQATPVPPAADAPGTPEPPTVTRHPLPGEGLTKYDRRSGVAPAAADAAHRDEAVAATSAEPDLEATEVVFDLRESEQGFEGSYWKQPAERSPDDTS